MAIVEASVWGTTVESAATARVQKIIDEGSLVELTQAVERCLLADLPRALDGLLATLADKAALDADVVHLMDALPALARAQRYGDVRQTDTRALRKVSEVLVVRICAGLADRRSRVWTRRTPPPCGAASMTSTPRSASLSRIGACDSRKDSTVRDTTSSVAFPLARHAGHDDRPN